MSSGRFRIWVPFSRWIDVYMDIGDLHLFCKDQKDRGERLTAYINIYIYTYIYVCINMYMHAWGMYIYVYNIYIYM